MEERRFGDQNFLSRRCHYLRKSIDSGQYGIVFIPEHPERQSGVVGVRPTPGNKWLGGPPVREVVRFGRNGRVETVDPGWIVVKNRRLCVLEPRLDDELVVGLELVELVTLKETFDPIQETIPAGFALW